LLAVTALAVTAIVDVLQVGLTLFRVGPTAGLLHGGFAFTFPGPFDAKDAPLPADLISIADLPVWKSTVVALLLSLRLLPGIFMLISLRTLFRAYAESRVFTENNTLQIQRIGRAMIAYAAVPLLTHASLYVMKLSPIALKLEVRQADAAAIGVILLAVAQVMSLGCEINDDLKSFV
jgi:hypothetical protein